MKILKLLIMSMLLCIGYNATAQQVNLNDDSLKHYYQQYEAYTPKEEEKTDYYKLKYILSWLLVDEAKVIENMKLLAARPFEGKVNTNLVLDLQYMDYKKLPKVYALLDRLIPQQTKANQLPLYISQVGVLEKMNDDALTLIELPKKYVHFQGNDSAIAYMDLLHMKVLSRNDKAAEAINIAANYLKKKPLNQEIFVTYVRTLYNAGMYQEVVNLEKQITSEKRMDIYPELALSLAALNKSKDALKYMDMMYSNMEYRMNEEIQASLSHHDSNTTLYPEAYIEYEHKDKSLGFYFIPVSQLEAMADVYANLDRKDKACTFYQYAVLGINAFDSTDPAVIKEEGKLIYNSKIEDFDSSLKKVHADNQKLKTVLLQKVKDLKQCNLFIK